MDNSNDNPVKNENPIGFDDFLPPPVTEEEEPPVNQSEMKIGERIKDLRMSMGMKPVDLAASIGKSVSYINTLEADRNDPYVQTLCLIAQKLGTTLRFLVLGDKNTSAEDNLPILGDELSRIRKENKMKASELARELDVSSSLINKIEKTSNLTIKTLYQYSVIFRYSFGRLLDCVTPEPVDEKKIQEKKQELAKKSSKEKNSDGNRFNTDSDDTVKKIKLLLFSDEDLDLLEKYNRAEPKIKEIVKSLLDG